MGKRKDKWNEVPIEIFIEPCQSYVALENESDRGVAVILKGQRVWNCRRKNLYHKVNDI